MNSIIAFDVDGVLLRSKSSWATVHDYFGVNNSESLNLYLNNKIDYREFVNRDVNLWIGKKGIIKYSDFMNIQKKVEPNPNYHMLSEFLKKFNGNKIAISGGVDVIVNKIKDFYPIEVIYSNKLIFKNGYLVGGEALVEPSQKGKILRGYNGRKISVGDSHWDIDMFVNSDYSILFNYEEDVDKVDLKIKGNDLAELTKVLNDFL